MKYLSRPMGSKRVLWFGDINRYMLVTGPAFSVIERLSEGVAHGAIASWCSDFYHLPPNEAQRFVNEVTELLENLQPDNTDLASNTLHPLSDTFLPAPDTQLPAFAFSRDYSISGITFRVEYQTAEIAFWIHPQFAHLEVDELAHCDNHFQVYESGDHVVFRVNGQIIGEWIPGEFISLLGKFYVEILNRIHGKTRSDWMAILHASAVSDGSSGVVFMGEVGHGKSTASAMLMANGFDLYADDFTPLDAGTGHVWYFPAALSVKKSAWEPLVNLFPQLKDAQELNYRAMNKTVRYLPPPKQPDTPVSSVPVRAIVFVKYKKNSGMRLRKVQPEVAFQKLIPGSWIAPEPDNVTRFLDWFAGTPCYQLTYSDTGAMVKAVRELLDSEG